MKEVFFEKDGFVSLWVGQEPVPPGSDQLRDKFGAEYYDLDFQDCILKEQVSPLSDIVPKLSYAVSFQREALEAAHKLGIDSALWVSAQYDYAYDPDIAGLESLPSEPLFIGCFTYHM